MTKIEDHATIPVQDSTQTTSAAAVEVPAWGMRTDRRGMTSPVSHPESDFLQAVVFDLDDTLYPEREFTRSGFRAVSEAFADVLGNAPAACARMNALFDSPHRSRVFNELLRERGVTDPARLVPAMIECYRSHVPSIALYPDADHALTRLKERFSLGLVSDGPRSAQRGKIAALGLQDRLDAIILTGELGDGFGKPHPRAFEEIARRLGVEPHRCAYVADNPAKDFVAPNRLGWRSIRVRRSDGVYANAAAPPDGEPSVTIVTLDDLDPLLRRTT
ncbi:MAG: HAD family hydrolase [Planctomycetota bacterium]|nr:MAG: HAD family hydrolase [Planctomycetota bacterium]KAB2943724.1 MAG: HAD family hydrolase [Phycisphaerae bacterium]